MLENITFDKASYDLNPQANFNFQLNRLILWNDGRLKDVKPIAHKIKDSATWKKEIVALGDTAIAEGRIRNAIGYYRMAEFFMYDGDPDKIKYYRLSRKYFYEYYKEIFDSGRIKQIEVPYEDKSLPVMYAKAVGSKIDTIILHGGNDSYYEEFMKVVLYLAEKGFDVYLLEGPGQGMCLRERDIKFIPEWEKPVSATLDALKLEDVTIIGASLGGMLAPRAAAFDQRIKRVIGWSIFTNFLDVALNELPKFTRKPIKFMLRNNIKAPINFMMNKKMKADNKIDWAIQHGMFAYDAESPFEYMKKLNKYQMLDIANRITQDVLVLAGENDHFIPLDFYKDELDSLINVNSLTYRVVTKRELGDNHCNVGNTELTLDIMSDWIIQMKK